MIGTGLYATPLRSRVLNPTLRSRAASIPSMGALHPAFRPEGLRAIIEFYFRRDVEAVFANKNWYLADLLNNFPV